MKSWILGLLALALCGASTCVMATPTLVGTTTDPTGIDGLVVGTTTYNVTFSITSFDSPFTYGTSASIAAAADLGTALNSLGVTELASTAPTNDGSLILGVDNSSGSNDETVCDAPCTSPNWSSASGSLPLAILGGNLAGFTNSMTYIEAADFAAVGANVPEPGTLSLFGLGLAGFALARRRRGQARSG